MTRLPAENKIASAALEKLKRVGRMGIREGFYRLSEKVRAELERVRWHKRRQPRAERTRAASFLDYLRGQPAGRFYFTPSARLDIFHRIAATHPEWIEAAELEADKLLNHRVTILGFGEIELGRDIDWHRDPVTGKCWPRRFWTDYDPVRDCTHGDSKIIHELNRHSFLPRLAKAYFLTGEEAYALETVSQLRSWIRQNPLLFGINWQSSLEIALRCTSWMWALFFLLPARSLDRESAELIGDSLFAQLEHVCRYPSIYSSPNTHLLGEATALCVAGILFPEHRSARRWYRRGMGLLLEQMKRQILPDGVHIELSTCYHCYTVDFCLQVIALAQRNGMEVRPELRSALERAIDFLAHVTLPDGTVPLLGDDDGGRGLTLTSGHYGRYPEAFCSGAVLFDRPDFKYLAGAFREDTFWLLGDAALKHFGALARRPPTVTGATFEPSGYSVQRSGWSATADHLIFDCGGLGLPSGGHGHADALSFTLVSGGREVLVDPGTCVYNGAARWRTHFRTTSAHNTVTVDDEPQSEPGGTFQWRLQARAHLRCRFEYPGVAYIEGEHDGYARLYEPVTHRRRVFYAGTYWALLDEFSGEGEHSFEAGYQFAPGLRVSAAGTGPDQCDVRVAARGEARLELIAFGSGPPKAYLVEGSERPAQGWVSRRYGHREPAPVLRVRMRAKAPALFATLLFPSAFFRGSVRQAVARRLEIGLEGLACEIRGECLEGHRPVHTVARRDSLSGIHGCRRIPAHTPGSSRDTPIDLRHRCTPNHSRRKGPVRESRTGAGPF